MVKKIAVTGKGGSGKTMLSALMIKLLAARGNLKILAIDADSAVNLPYALGVEHRETVARIRKEIIEDPKSRAHIEDKSIRTVMQEALSQGEGFQLLVMGRPEGPGCYCSINDLLKYGIDGLAQQFDVAIIDCEAGPEQVNRRVVKSVDLLVIVTETSLRGARVTGEIVEVSRSSESIKPGEVAIVVNRFRGDDGLIRDYAERWGVGILGRIPHDDNITKYDSSGRPLIELPDTSPSVAAVEEILREILP